MIIILIGAPGSGKGTQAAFLSERFGLTHLSTGDIFRSEISSKTPLGQQAAKYVSKGQLVPDSLVTEMVASRLSDPQGGRYLLDGFPRNLAQAQALSSLLSQKGAGVDSVFFLNLSSLEAIKRLTSRRLCGGCGEVYNVLSRPPQAEGKCDKCGKGLVVRDDDTEATSRKRLMVYEDLTRPLVAYYKTEGAFHEVDAARPPQDVSAQLGAIITPLVSGARS